MNKLTQQFGYRYHIIKPLHKECDVVVLHNASALNHIWTKQVTENTSFSYQSFKLDVKQALVSTN